MIRTHRSLVAVAAVAAVAATSGFGTAAAVGRAHATTGPTTVSVKVTNKAISFTGGTHLSAGRYAFDVRTPKGDHTLQLLRLHKGYSAKQLQQDIAAGVDTNGQPNLHAVRRLDRRVTWLGGAETKPGRSGEFAALLTAGRYIALDQDGPAHAQLKVSGSASGAASVPVSATVIGTSADRWKAPKVLPHHGWVRTRDTSSEAHFLIVQRVKSSTTNAKVRRYVHHALKTGSQKNPPWLTHPSTNSGVFSKGANVDFHLSLPTGKYLLACFWPSKSTGMPHFLMGMWKLVQLR